jgi:hypothetical protein
MATITDSNNNTNNSNSTLTHLAHTVIRYSSIVVPCISALARAPDTITTSALNTNGPDASSSVDGGRSNTNPSKHGDDHDHHPGACVFHPRLPTVFQQQHYSRYYARSPPTLARSVPGLVGKGVKVDEN